ncbi:MAG: tRNA 2-thiouridine(34) synthase MnmA [Actinomycetota bacterium]|nr:tRNA 2-thiouridine(34) synthase MnmA [Actinomycetota bacterium]
MPKVIVGMSGGVDSSVAALLLKKEGFEVEGVSLLMFENRGKTKTCASSCCSLETAQEAGRTAEAIGVPFKIVDARDLFIEKVINPFVRSYAAGFTPNPCILCNMHVKFPVLLQEAGESAAEFIASGHYARIERNNGDVKLLAGLDPAKDQSYVLYAQKKGQLERLLLPLGKLKKAEVRAIAHAAGLPVFNKPESQEICFTGGDDYRTALKELGHESMKEGPVYYQDGRRIGTHSGVCAFTIGQRKGFRVQNPAPGPPRPLYVYRIDASENAIYVGEREKALSKRVLVSGINWLSQPAKWPFRAGVKVRSMMRPAPALVQMTGEDGLLIELDGPQWAPAPGQSAVLYDGDAVLGGGIIALQ